MAVLGAHGGSPIISHLGQVVVLRTFRSLDRTSVAVFSLFLGAMSHPIQLQVEQQHLSRMTHVRASAAAKSGNLEDTFATHYPLCNVPSNPAVYLAYMNFVNMSFDHVRLHPVPVRRCVGVEPSFLMGFLLD